MAMGRADTLAQLRRAAESLGECDALAPFHEGVLYALVEDDAARVGYGVLLARLRTCVAARAELHALERGMQQGEFVRLVTGGYFVSRGVCVCGGAAQWLRLGAFYKGSWRADTGGRKALVRALVWFFEVATVGLGYPFDQKAVFFVDADVGLVDFSVEVVAETMRLIDRVFPLDNRARFVFFGVPGVVPMMFNTIQRLVPRHSPFFSVCVDYADALDLIVDEADVPEFWLDPHAARDEYATDRRSTWCYERCLSDKNRVVTEDVFKPGPWPYWDVDAKEGGCHNSGPEGLEPICE